MLGKVSTCVTTLWQEIALFYTIQIFGKIESSKAEILRIGNAEGVAQLKLRFEMRRGEFGIWRNNAAGDSDIFAGEFGKREMLKRRGRVHYSYFVLQEIDYQIIQDDDWLSPYIQKV